MNTPSPNATIPFAVATLGIATFAMMDVLMKGLSIEYGAYNAIFWRIPFAVPMATILFFWKRQGWPEKSTVWLHIWRALVTAVMAFFFFWGLARVPLAEAIGLSFIAPLIALYLAVLLLKEQIGKTAIFASILGFAGALVIIGGKLGGDYSEDVGLGIAAILFSAVLYGYNLILQRQQALLASPYEIAFFQNIVVAILFGCFAPFYANIPAVEALPNFAGAAFLALVSLLLLSWAYARAEAKILIPVEYTAFVWAALFGWLVFAEDVTLATLTGTFLIVAGCLIAARQKAEVVDHIETTAL